MREDDPKYPINPYGASKVGAEAICHVYHHIYQLQVNIIRIFALYDPYGRPDMIPRQLIKKIYRGETIQKFGVGDATRDWLYVEDAAEAVLTAVHRHSGFQIFNIGSGKSTSLNDLIAIGEDIVGQTTIINNLPVPPGDAHFVGIADYSKARQLPGWQPKFSLREGLNRTLLNLVENSQSIRFT